MTESQAELYRVGYRSIALRRLNWDEGKLADASPEPVEDPDLSVGEVVWDRERHVYVLSDGYGQVKWLLEHGGDRHRYWFHLLRARVPAVPAV